MEGRRMRSLTFQELRPIRKRAYCCCDQARGMKDGRGKMGGREDGRRREGRDGGRERRERDL